MKISNVHLKLENLTNGGDVILTEYRPAFAYRDGKRIDTEVVGRKATVVLPSNAYDTLTVTVADPVDAISPALAKASAEKKPLYVTFDNFEARIYVMQGNAGVSARASAIHIVSGPQKIDDDNFLLIE